MKGEKIYFPGGVVSKKALFDTDIGSVFFGGDKNAHSKVKKYLKSMVNQKREKGIQPTPLVKELSGIIHLNSDADLKEIYSGYLLDKYSSD